MSETRRGAGAPFYAPPRRKTSAEIISEARAAVYGEMSGSSSAASGGLRPLRTRRPYTPREPQRTLFDRKDGRKREKDTRPPSAFDLKYLSLSESSEEALLTMGARVAAVDDDPFAFGIPAELMPQNLYRRKNTIRTQSRSVQDRSGDSWGVFPKLPHLNGKAKPLHRRNTSHSTPEEPIAELSQSISISPIGGTDCDIKTGNKESAQMSTSKSLSPEPGSKRRVYAGTKSKSCDTNISRTVGDIGVKHLAVQLPNTSSDQLDSMSILELCDALSQRSGDVDRNIILMDTLQSRLDAATPASSLRELVLRALYTHIDSEDERVLVAIARAMLSMRVTGPHLAAACKLVFKIARNDKNDHFFRDTNLIELLVEGCGRADPVTESECCVYGAGALRVLALEPKLAARARCHGAVHLAAIHLKLLNTAKADNPRSVSDQCTHALYQLTGALRNLAGEARAASEFLSSGALAELVTALLYHTDRDVLTNVARCLSVLSVQEACCEWLCSSGTATRALLRALAACAARAPLAVRLAYTLGNMAAADEKARNNIYNEEGGIDVLLTILESYTKRNELEARDFDTDPDLHLIGTDLGGSDGSNEDVLIKTVRVVANLCLTESIGRSLAAAHAGRTIKALLSCLDLAEKPTDHLSISFEERTSLSERRQELATAALATLNNVTFYRDPAEPPDPLAETLDSICKVTCRWLAVSNSASCEAARALGNLTRCARAAQLFVLEGALDSLAPFLDHEDPAVRCSAAGVLVNVCGAGADSSSAGELAAKALEGAARRNDAPAAALLARAVWNAHAHTPLNVERAMAAAKSLTHFIDDDSVFTACEAYRNDKRRASDPSLNKHQVSFDSANYNGSKIRFSRTMSVDQDLNIQENTSEDETLSGEDLGFEDGDVGVGECDCDPCLRLAAWEELVGVAIPLMEKLRPPKADASVGTD